MISLSNWLSIVPWIWTVLAATLVLVIFSFRRRSKLRLPNPVPRGPRLHWLTGNTRIAPEDLAETLFSWRAEHGPIFEFEMLPRQALFVVINDINVAKEMLHRREFGGRDTLDNAVMRITNPNLVGIAHQSWSTDWQKLHRFVSSTLSSMGFGRARMETKVLSEADALVDAMLAKKGVAFDPGVLIRVAVSNVITNVVFGMRSELEQSSPLQDAFNTHIEGFFYLLYHPVYNTLPIFMRLFPSKKLKETLQAKKLCEEFIGNILEEHKSSLDPNNDDPRDFMDAILMERRKFPEAKHLSAENVERIIIDLSNGGTDTTAASITWIIAWLLRRPDVAADLRREIEAVIGSAAPSLDALEKFHLVRSFIDETIRKSSVTDMTLPHRLMKTGVQLAGFDMPENQIVMVNLWGIHHDPSLWHNPMSFEPGRFLNEKKEYMRNENLIPFGLGERRCIGEKLAKLELFLFTVRILQRVKFHLADGCEMPAMKGRKPGFRLPEQYEIIVEPF